MIDGTLLLIGRQTDQPDRTIKTHAQRLRERGIADSVRVERYDDEWSPIGDGYEDLPNGDVYLVPMIMAKTNESKHAILAVASSIIDSAYLCKSVGCNPAVTDIIVDRASEQLEPAADTSLVLVGLGSSSMPHQRHLLEYYEERLHEQTDYGEVTSCYLLQDPVVECARYNVSNERMVAVPVFVSPCTATEEEIPAKLELDRGDIEYTDSVGTHPRFTDAIHAEVVKRNALEMHNDSKPIAIDGLLTASHHPVATDGRGAVR